MKKFFFSILAVGALVACTKSEVKFDDASAIAFAPVASTITKAAINTNTFPKDRDFQVWAFYCKDAPVQTPTVPEYNNYTTKYIEHKTFTRRVNSNAWGGKESSYYWPNNGSLVFAGYSAPMVLNPTYDLSKDKLSISGYTQPAIDEAYTELLWFGRGDSYNNKAIKENVKVVFQHALSWITLKFQGKGMTADVSNQWLIKKVVINDVSMTGNVECVGDNATWKDWSNECDLIVYENNTGHQLTASAVTLENVARGTLVIPQTPTTATITYTCLTPAGETITEEVVAELKLDGNATSWENNKHYTYTITFSATEILIEPSVVDWTEVEVIDRPAN